MSLGHLEAFWSPFPQNVITFMVLTKHKVH